jgi:hypothetical protein
MSPACPRRLVAGSSTGPGGVLDDSRKCPRAALQRCNERTTCRAIDSCRCDSRAFGSAIVATRSACRAGFGAGRKGERSCGAEGAGGKEGVSAWRGTAGGCAREQRPARCGSALLSERALPWLRAHAPLSGRRDGTQAQGHSRSVRGREGRAVRSQRRERSLARIHRCACCREGSAGRPLSIVLPALELRTGRQAGRSGGPWAERGPVCSKAQAERAASRWAARRWGGMRRQQGPCREGGKAQGS